MAAAAVFPTPRKRRQSVPTVTAFNFQQVIGLLAEATAQEGIVRTLPRSAAVEAAENTRLLVGRMVSYLSSALVTGTIRTLPNVVVQINAFVAVRPQNATQLLDDWVQTVFSSSDKIADYLLQPQNLSLLDAVMSYAQPDWLEAIFEGRNYVSVAGYEGERILDARVLRILQYVHSRNPELFVRVYIPYLRQESFPNPNLYNLGVMWGHYFQHTRQWLAAISRPAVREYVPFAIRRHFRECLVMESNDEKRGLCTNNEGNLAGDRWCDVPRWAVYRHNRYCYDIRELLQSIASQVQGSVDARPTSPSLPWDRSPISIPTVLNFVRLAKENYHELPENVVRIVRVYEKSRGQAGVAGTNPAGEPLFSANVLALWSQYRWDD